MGDYSFLNREFLVRTKCSRVVRSDSGRRQSSGVPKPPDVEDDDLPDDGLNRDGVPLLPPKQPVSVIVRKAEVGKQSPAVDISCLWDDVVLTVLVLCIGIVDVAIGVVALVSVELATATFTGLNYTVINLVGESSNEMRNLVLGEIYNIVTFGAFGEIGAGIFSLIAVAYRVARWIRRQPFNGANFQSVFLITFGVGAAAFFASEGATGWVSLFDGSALADTSGEALGIARVVGRYILLVRVVTSLFALLASLVTYRSSWAWLSG